MVINDQVASVFQSDCVYPGVRIGQRGQTHLAPGFAVIAGPNFANFALPRPRYGLESSLFVEQNAGLNGPDFFAVVYWPDKLPGLPQVARALEMNAPAHVLSAAGA